MDIFNVKSYGATGNGVADDTSAIVAAKNAMISAGGGVLYFPPGIYRASQTIDMALNGQIAVAIKGDGMDVSEVRFGDTDGFKATAESGNYWIRAAGQKFAAFHVSDMTISTTSVSNSRHALWYYGGSVVGRPMPEPTITRVAFRGSETMEQGWLTGIVFEDAADTHVTDCEFAVCGADHYQGRGIVYWTSESGKDATNHFIAGSNFYYGAYGVVATQYCEGISLTNCTIVGSKYGVYWDCGDGGESLLAMKNCHVSAAVRDVYTHGVFDSNISGCLFYQNNSLAGNSNGAENWAGIEMTNTGSTSLIGNIIRGQGTDSTAQTENCIIIDNANTGGDRGMTIVGNCLERVRGTGAWLRSNTRNIVLASNAYAQCGNPYVNSGSNNRILD